MRNFLSKLKSKEVHVRLKDGELSVHMPKSGVDGNLVEEIRARKEELIQYLSELNAPTSQIPIVPQATDYELSSAQYRLWVLSQTIEGNLAHTIPGFYELKGSLDLAALQEAFDHIIERHDSLRTIFVEKENGTVRQKILVHEAAGAHIKFKNLTDFKNAEELIDQEINALLSEPFELAAGPLIRVRLYQLANERYVFGYTMHHIISDGWSMEVLIGELFNLYSAFTQGLQSPLKPLKIQYKDYAVWQKTKLSGQSSYKKYWLKSFEGDIPVLELPSDKPRPVVKTFPGNGFEKRINDNTSAKLQQICKENGATIFMGMVTCLNALFSKLSGQHDVVLGTPIAGRESVELEEQIGLYINTLAIRSQFSETDSFTSLLNKTKEAMIGAFAHQQYPFDKLVEDLQVKRDVSRNPLFDVLVTYREEQMSGQQDDQGLAGIEISSYGADDELISKFDLTFTFQDSEDYLDVNVVYNTDLYFPSTIEKMLEQFELVLNTWTENVNLELEKISLLLPTEIESISKFNSTHVEHK
ncbi:MAG: hypothetical protein JKY54_06030, partial [Flavobacteriales bacterium]|nr:hypothetical protein [Flavobacteriales bacterium]